MKHLASIAIVAVILWVLYSKGFLDKILSNSGSIKEEFFPMTETERTEEQIIAENELRSSYEGEDVVNDALTYIQSSVQKTGWWQEVLKEAERNQRRPWEIIYSRALGQAQVKQHYKW